MKNQYFGDVGDFGKYGLLSAICESKLRLGINWYLTNNDEKTDGKHIDYLRKKEFQKCDYELHSFLESSIQENRRNVSEIYQFEKFKSCLFYDEILELEHINALSEKGRIERRQTRTKWFLKGLEKLDGSEIIFCDPDNGIETKSQSKYGKGSVKYTLIEEIQIMISLGKSLIVYNHRDRSTEEAYSKRFKEIHNLVGLETELRVLRFNRYSVRDYLIFIQPQHKEVLMPHIDRFINDRHWREHFKEYQIET